MELLKDPGNTRAVKQVPLPAQTINSEALFTSEGIDIKLLTQFLQKQGHLFFKDFKRIIAEASNIFKGQGNVILINDPITIVGDIHGQFYDLLRMFETDVGGSPETTKYLFLGDYVDRGNFSVEVLILLLTLKIKTPSRVIMLRGNHESRRMTIEHNFRNQCLAKYNQHIYELLMQLFDNLPLVCVVNRKFFMCAWRSFSLISPCIYLSSQLEDVAKINRVQEIPLNGLFTDLMWADPMNPRNQTNKFLVIPNTERGCSHFFGPELTRKMLPKNNLVSIIRAHQVKDEGFQMLHWNDANFPTVVTVFSAPNYCSYYKNKASVIKINNNHMNVQRFTQSVSPYMLPKFMDAINWSIPFLVQKCVQIMNFLIKPDPSKELEDVVPEMILKRQSIQEILKKVSSSTLQNLGLTQLEGECPDDNLLGLEEYPMSKKKSFEEKQAIDSQNEGLPMRIRSQQNIDASAVPNEQAKEKAPQQK